MHLQPVNPRDPDPDAQKPEPPRREKDEWLPWEKQVWIMTAIWAFFLGLTILHNLQPAPPPTDTTTTTCAGRACYSTTNSDTK